MTKYLKEFETETDYKEFKNATYNSEPSVNYIKESSVLHYDLLPFEELYLTFEVLEPGTITIKSQHNAFNPVVKTIQYSIDNGNTWISITTSGNQQSLGGNLSTGDKVLVKGNNTTYAMSTVDLNYFGGTAKVKVYGNIMSLIGGDNFKNLKILSEAYAFCGLFTHNSNLISAENLILPATTLSDRCYSFMFNECSSLIKIPTLIATKLANYCYWAMFNKCTSLTDIPKFPEATLTEGCYGAMFGNCLSLTIPPELPATTLAKQCYDSMFYNCTSLISAPQLPATTLTYWCYALMFQGCTSLNYIKMMATDISATNCLSNWVSGVNSSGTFIKNANTTIPTGTSGIPSGWTVLTE